jgi:hypothetical protein
MFKTLKTRRPAILSIVLAGVGAAGVSAAPAQAAVTPASSCAAGGSLSQPFAAWGDTNEYRLIQGGDFTNGAPGWTLGNGAAIVSGGDPFDLTGTPSAVSLSLAAGATATSPMTCVDATQPTFRFLDVADTTGSSVAVSVSYAAGKGSVTVPVGVLTGSGAWQPSPAYQDGSVIASLLQGGTAQMAVSFTALSGQTQINDVFVDPRQGWN